MQDSVNPRRNLRWLWLSVAVIVLDQLTKQLAVDLLEMHQPVAVAPFLNLTLTYNTGAAFSLLNDAGGWQRWLFAGLSVVVSIVIVAWLWGIPSRERWLACGLALVLGGALGNLWDRLLIGAVVDFIDVYYQRWHWPAFNVADSAICVGAALLIISTFKARPEE
jgi:signal peptidase II